LQRKQLGGYVNIDTNKKLVVSGVGADNASNSCAVTRRQALLLAAGAGVLSLLPIFKASANTPDQWVAVGKPGDFNVGTPVKVSPAVSEILYVSRIDSKTLIAISSKCTHRGCEVNWVPADTQFECPCHGSAFTLTGKYVHGTRRAPTEVFPSLLSLPVRESDGSVEVNLAGIAPDLLEPRVRPAPPQAPPG
jgi:nitrite reductase/ring-hydroxylating ferredoxin subunit